MTTLGMHLLTKKGKDGTEEMDEESAEKGDESPSAGDDGSQQMEEAEA